MTYMMYDFDLGYVQVTNQINGNSKLVAFLLDVDIVN